MLFSFEAEFVFNFSEIVEDHLVSHIIQFKYSIEPPEDGIANTSGLSYG